MAIQQGKDPAIARMKFYYHHEGSNQPAALIRPEDNRGWFWILDSVMTPAGLYVFLIQIERTPGNEAFNFKVVGTWLGLVANPEESPAHWRIMKTKVPWSTFSAAGGLPYTAVMHFNPHRNLFGSGRPDYYAAITDAYIIYPWEVDRGPDKVERIFLGEG